MRRRLLALASIAACGGGATTVDATRDATCAPTSVYLNRHGGAYDKGGVDDATTHRSVVLDGPRALAPWPHDEATWRAEVACITAAVAPLAITLTEVDPGPVPHLELVFTTAYWGAGGAGVSTIIPDSCRPDHQLEFVFGSALPTSTRTCEAAMLAFGELAAQLSPGEDCLDFVNAGVDCGIRAFLDQPVRCVDATDRPAPCRCGGGTTENVLAALRARFPTCP
jgi:hypothetical protein